MGVLSTEHTDHVADMASAKPRERQFQVVPVPGTFTRGRWKCWDYKDKPSNVGEILDFTDKADKGAQLLSMTAETQSQSATVANAQPSASGDALTHTVSEPQLQSSTVGVAPIPPVCSSSSAALPIDVAANGLKESRTIVVTSIAPPPPVTPVRETPSVDALPVHDPNVNLSTVNAQLPPSTLTIVNENGTVGEEASSMLSPPLTLSTGTTTVSSSTSIPTGSLSPQSESSPTLPACSYVSCPPPNSFATPPLVTSFIGSQASNSFASPPSVINFMSPAASSVSSSSVTSFVNPPVAAVGTGATAQQPQQPAAHGLSRETSVVQSTPSATLSRQTSIASFTDSGVPIVATASAVSALPPIDGSAEDPTATGSAPSGPNVAIDNKIEQAMDLVKTHLTFAVREEVEILRSTIVDLESKVAHLESQNQVLKQFAPAEVVANLALLVQNAQQQKQLQQQIQQIPTAAVSSAQPVIVNTQPSHPVVVQQQPITATSPPPTPVVMQPQQAQTMNQGVTLHPQQPLASVTSAPLLLPSAAAASLGDSLVSSASFAASGPQAFPTTVPSPQTFPATAPGAQTFPAAVPESLGSPSSVIGGASGSSAVP